MIFLLKINDLTLLGVLLLLPCIAFSSPQSAEKETKLTYIQIALDDADIIGQKIWMNEGAGKVENLTVWNKYEDFASLGIGHFIWYPANKEGLYTETFPQLILFLQQQGIQIPAWLQNQPDAPWNSREDFKYHEQSEQMKQLRTLLVNTIPQQVQFIIKRLERALPKMLNTLSHTSVQRQHIQTQFHRVAQTRNGVYTLIDYINFKGEGTSLKERYQGQGWGLLQVLENMSGRSTDPVAEFVQSAKFILNLRIQNSPPERHERYWFPGWKKRLQTYLELF